MLSGTTGVYVIENVINRKVYVGSAAQSFAARWRVHRHQLKHGKHHSRHLQRAWDKHGEAAFEFQKVVCCPPAECLAQEQVVIDRFDAANPEFGYNLHANAANSRGRLHTEEAKAKISLAGRGRKASAATLAKMSAANIGRKHSEKTVAEMRSRRHSDEAKARIASYATGRLMGVRARHKRSKSKKALYATRVST